MSSFRSVWLQIRGTPLGTCALCFGAWTLINMDQALFLYAVPGIRIEFAVDLNQIGWILSATFAVSIAASVIMGMVADRIGRKSTLIISLIISGVLVGLQGFAGDIWTLAGLRLLSVGMSGAVAPIALTYTAEEAPPRYRGLMTGLLIIGYPFGWFVASLVAAPLMAMYGWRAIFLIAFATVPFTLVLARWLKESRRFEMLRAEKPVPYHWVAQLKTLFGPALRHRTIFAALSSIAFGGAYGATAFFFPTFYHEVRGYSEVDATRIVGLSYGIGIFGYLLSAAVGEFVMTRRDTLKIAYWIGSMALLGLIWLPSSYAEDIFWFGAMVTFLYGSQAVNGLWLCELFPIEVRATGTAFAGTGGQNLGLAVFPLVTSHAVSFVGWRWAYTIAVPLGLLAGLAVLCTENRKSGLILDDTLAVRTSQGT